MLFYIADPTCQGTVFKAEENGHQMRFNWNLYQRFFFERGCSVDRTIYDHPLTGKQIELLNGSVWTVEKVVENWYLGYYEVATCVNSEGLHCIVIVKNISSRCATIAEADFEVL